MESNEPSSRRDERRSKVKNQGQIIITVLVTLLAVVIIYRAGVLKSIGFSPSSADTKNAALQVGSASIPPPKILDQPKFSVRYPGSWAELTPVELSAFKEEFTAGIKRAKPPALMGVKIKSVKDDESSLKKLPGTLDKLLDATFKNFKRVDASTSVIDGHQVLRYVYDFDSAAGQRIEQQQYVMIKDGSAYYLFFHLRATDSSHLKADISSIVSSIKLK